MRELQNNSYQRAAARVEKSVTQQTNHINNITSHRTPHKRAYPPYPPGGAANPDFRFSVLLGYQ